jgi:hypothetical protein
VSELTITTTGGFATDAFVERLEELARCLCAEYESTSLVLPAPIESAASHVRPPLLDERCRTQSHEQRGERSHVHARRGAAVEALPQPHYGYEIERDRERRS